MKKLQIFLVILFLVALNILTYIVCSDNLSITLIIKLFFLLTFLLMTFYLIFQEHMINKAKRKDGSSLKELVTMDKGGIPNKTLKDIIFKYVLSLLTYEAFIDSLKKNNATVVNDENTENKVISQLRKEYLIAQEALRKTENVAEAEKLKWSSKLAELDDKSKNVDPLIQKNSNLNKEFQDILNLKFQLKENPAKKFNNEELKLLVKDKFFEKDIEINSLELSGARNDLVKFTEDLKKGSIGPIDFNFNEFMNKLSGIELFALGNLLLNNIILSYTITIILIIYGDFLIIRFDLDNKYPKLAKIIKWRRKLQQYYLKISFIWIFAALLPQFYINLYILLPKLLEIMKNFF